MKILNLTQHPATAEQIAQGVIDIKVEQLSILKELLTFDELPDAFDIVRAAEGIAVLAEINAESHECKAMIGGSPFLMSALENALRDVNITPIYAFSARESVETAHPNGCVIKTNMFRHIGFIEV